MRFVILAAVATCCISCAVEPLSEPRAVSQTGDPSIDGKDYLLSEPGFRALLIVARERLAHYPYRPAIYNVNVISATKVRVHFRDEDGTMKGRWILLERMHGEWRIIEEQSLAERVILT